MTKSNYRSLAYYQNIQKKFQNDKNFMKSYTKHVGNIKGAGNCLFALSFLCCCCCSSLGGNSLMLADFGRFWMTALTQTYGDQNNEKIKKLFQNALCILEKVQKQVIKKNEELKEKTQNLRSLSVKEYDSYNYNQLTYNTQYIMNDGWLHEIFSRLYRNRTVELEQIPRLTDAETSTLFMVLPLFYPVVFKTERMSYLLNAKTISDIRDLLSKM